MRRALLVLAAVAGLALPCAAHDGPPFPIIVDKPFGGRTLSVWADPDVGVGTFYIYLPEEEDGGAALLGEAKVSVWVQPADGRLPEVEHVAEPAEARQPYQRIIEADFDRRGPWKVRFEIDAPDEPNAISREIEVTPPGGKLALLWFLAPFLTVAFLWWKAVQQRRAYARSQT